MSVFRKEYRKLSDEEQKLINDIKDKAEELMTLYVNLKIKIDQRYMALARTELENSVMWATKAIS